MHERVVHQQYSGTIPTATPLSAIVGSAHSEDEVMEDEDDNAVSGGEEQQVSVNLTPSSLTAHSMSSYNLALLRMNASPSPSGSVASQSSASATSV